MPKLKGMIVICDDFRTNVREVLAEKGWTQEHLATIMGVTPSYISQLIGGYREPGLSVVGRVAAALDVPACRLVEKKTPMVAKKL